jgi:hypothetical protein
MGVSNLNIVLEIGHRIVTAEARLGRIIRTAPSLSLASPGWLYGCKARALSVSSVAAPGPAHWFAHPFPRVDEHFSHPSEYCLIHPSQDSVIPSVQGFYHPSVQRFRHPIHPNILSAIYLKILSSHPSKDSFIHLVSTT